MIHDAAVQPEIQARLAAVSRSFFKRGVLWTRPGIPFRMRRLFIISDIQNSALAGLEAFTISKRQLFQLDGAVARVCRTALRGKAVSREDEGNVTHCLSNAGVLKCWRLGLADTELVIRRLRWLQAMTRDIDQHHLVINSIFGHCRGEMRAGIPPTVVEGLRAH